jgi:hypothetical protein
MESGACLPPFRPCLSVTHRHTTPYVVCCAQPYLLPYREKLKRLISEQTFREEMATFHLLPSASTIHASHRLPLAAVLIRCLLPKLLKRNTTQSKSTLASRRAAVCSYLGGLSSREIEPLLHMLLQPFVSVVSGLCGVDSQVLVRSSDRAVALEADMSTGGGVLYECVPSAAFWDVMRHPSQLAQLLSAAAPPPSTSSSTPSPASLLYALSQHRPPLATRIGLFKLLQHLLSQLRHVIPPYLSVLCALLVVCGVSAQAALDAKRAADKEEKEKEKKAGEAEVVVDEEEVDEPAEEEDEEQPTSKAGGRARSRSRSRPSASAPASTSAVSGGSRYSLNEQRTIRQLCFSRMAQMLDLFPEQFSAGLTLTSAATLTKQVNTKTRYLPSPNACAESLCRLRLTCALFFLDCVALGWGCSLLPFLEVFLARSSDAIKRLPMEGAQHRGGLMDCLVCDVTCRALRCALCLLAC